MTTEHDKLIESLDPFENLDAALAKLDVVIGRCGSDGDTVSGMTRDCAMLLRKRIQCVRDKLETQHGDVK